MKLKKVLYVFFMVMLIIACTGFIFGMLGEELSADIITTAIIFFTGYGIYAFVKKLKEKG